jgi:hypothetical protein
MPGGCNGTWKLASSAGNPHLALAPDAVLPLVSGKQKVSCALRLAAGPAQISMDQCFEGTIDGPNHTFTCAGSPVPTTWTVGLTAPDPSGGYQGIARIQAESPCQPDAAPYTATATFVLHPTAT